MVMELSTILGTVEFAKAVASYLGIVTDKLAVKLDELADSEFQAGVRALQQAGRSETEQASLLREARYRLNKAVSLEKGIRLATAHLGLAMCHHFLGDHGNRQSALDDLMLVTIERSRWLPVAKALTLVPGAHEFVVISELHAAFDEYKLNNLKRAVQAFTEGKSVTSAGDIADAIEIALSDDFVIRINGQGAQTAAALARRLLIASMACVVVWQLAQDESPAAVQLRDILIRLSGRQMKRGCKFTMPALLAGLWGLLSMFSVLEEHNLTDLRKLAKQVLSLPRAGPNADS
ncbi:MAG: hypothetical protein ACR2FY_05690 [Pirellulaceae bacterium]